MENSIKKKIHLITCPTKNTLNYIKSFNFVESSKIKLLYDPVLNIKEINKKEKKKKNIFRKLLLVCWKINKTKKILCFYVRLFKILTKENDELKLAIAGNGEDDKQKLEFH